MKPRILIFSIAYEPLVGGAELAVRNLTDRIFDYEFDLVTCRFDRKHKPFEKIGNVNVYRVGFGSRLGRFLYPVAAFRLAKKLHKARPYQIVWSIMAAYAGAAALLFLRRFPQVKLLLTLQEGDEISYIHRQVRGFRRQWQKIFQRADYIQTISQYLARWARQEGATCPVEVVPNGVDLKNFQFPISNFQKNSKSQISNTKRIITVSRLVPKNGVDILIRAFAVIASPPQAGEAIPKQKEIASSSLDKLETPRNDIKLLILGTGPEEQKLKNLSHELKVDSCVEFLGNIDPDKVSEYLAQADIFARPSRSEGLGSAFLEAMAAGLPVIGTRVGGIPEIIFDRQNGLLVNPEDPKDLAEKLKTLIEDDNLRRELGQNGRNLVEEKYDWNKIAQSMKKIFSSLLA